jgi:hypothetical protein
MNQRPEFTLDHAPLRDSSSCQSPPFLRDTALDFMAPSGGLKRVELTHIWLNSE